MFLCFYLTFIIKFNLQFNKRHWWLITLINIDVNECERIPDICRRNQKCINSNGSYRCHALLQCSGGYMSNPEGTKCIGKANN